MLQFDDAIRSTEYFFQNRKGLMRKYKRQFERMERRVDQDS
jgi:hypothetical protein